MLLGAAGIFGHVAHAQMSRTIVQSVLAGTDDAEECMPGGSGTVGAMDLTSSDLEIMNDGSKLQLIGLRFTDLDIPQGATIQHAYIQFTTKGDKDPVLGDAYITFQDADNADGFSAAAFNISTRPQVPGSIAWSGSTSSSWGTSSANVSGAAQRTADLGSILQFGVINRPGWAPGNAIVAILSGTGVRNAFSYDGSPSAAAKLIVTYSAPGLADLLPTALPVAAGSDWKYLDDGTNMGTTWTSNAFDDSQWSYGPGKLGYSDNPVTPLSYGPDANDKYITYYFRKEIQVADVAALQDSLNLGLLRDDGAIVYINGTEVVRSNMPAGAFDYLTFAPTIIDGAEESVYQPFRISKDVLITGSNTIAVELHQRDGTSSDLGFDMTLSEHFPPPPPVVCDPLPATHISEFVSVLPSAQPDSLRIPATHTFQMIVQSGDPYTNPADGTTKGLFDFTGYVGIDGSSTNGYLSINHENGSWPDAGVSMLRMNFDAGTKTWNVTNNVPVDFGAAGGTGRNCSGAVTPWGTIITCEETLPAADVNADGYQDIGWAVEIDPATHTIKDYDGDGQPDKLWGVGRMSHENVVVASDSVTLYEGNDENPGYVFKFVANAPGNLSSGTLYVLQLTGAISVATTGTWIPVPNSTPAECNNVTSFATSVGATNFNSVEDVEISPLDSMIYFTSKSSSRVYRFRDNKTVGTTSDVTHCDIFVGNANTLYTIDYDGGSADEEWRSGNDNLTFDDAGNLYVIQDGGRNHIWMVRPCHTIAEPKVELFAVTPAGCEPTGMTFSPDYKFMFVSMQHPSAANTTGMVDATGNSVVFNKESAIAIARKEFLGLDAPLPVSFQSFEAHRTATNQAELNWAFASTEALTTFEVERMVEGGNFETLATLPATDKNSGKYSYLDKTPYAGQNFYRIKSVQENGKAIYTNIRMVAIGIGTQATLLNAYPNPAQEQFMIALINPQEQQAHISIYNASGAMMTQEVTNLEKGNATLSLNIANLPSGVYQVMIQIGKETLTTKMVKN